MIFSYFVNFTTIFDFFVVNFLFYIFYLNKNNTKSFVDYLLLQNTAFQMNLFWSVEIIIKNPFLKTRHDPTVEIKCKSKLFMR